jgi:hypothetical protein
MSSELRLDLPAMERLWGDLLHVSLAFSSISYEDAGLQEAVGNPHLAARVHEFSEGWRNRREVIVQSLDSIWHACRAIQTTFEDVDTELTRVLNQGD